MKRKKPTKPYWEMTVEELAEATREYDKPIPASRLKPLTKKQRAWWESVRRGPVRSITIRSGPRALTVDVEADLFNRVDRFAKRKKLTHAEAVARGLRGLLAFGE